MYKIIMLRTNRGNRFWISECDLDILRAVRPWNESAGRVSVKDGEDWIPITHAFLKPPGRMVVDHRDGNTFNNTRENLRICSHSQNLMNTGPKGTAANNLYKGVYANERNTAWQARVWNNGVLVPGSFCESRVEAAKEYDKLCLKLRGEFAWLNFPLVGRVQHGNPAPGPWNDKDPSPPSAPPPVAADR